MKASRTLSFTTCPPSVSGTDSPITRFTPTTWPPCLPSKPPSLCPPQGLGSHWASAWKAHHLALISAYWSLLLRSWLSDVTSWESLHDPTLHLTFLSSVKFLRHVSLATILLSYYLPPYSRSLPCHEGRGRSAFGTQCLEHGEWHRVGIWWTCVQWMNDCMKILPMLLVTGSHVSSSSLST